MKNILTIVCLSVSLLGKAQQKPPLSSTPLTLGLKNAFYSKILNEYRILNIYLPDGYNPKDTIKYPVIYLLDGSVDEDFIHITGIVQYYSFEWIQILPKSIVVGIATVDRKRDFTFVSKHEKEKEKFPSSGNSDQFISFIENELQPYIQQNFSVRNEKTIIGQSLGGLLCTEILLKKPNLFHRYIIVSPSLWWDDASLLSHNTMPFENKEIYIGVGKEGLTPSVNPRVMEVDANLLAEKINQLNFKNVKVIFDYLPEENHATIMHQAVLNAFKLLSINFRK